jgi:hypothetical protein
LENRIMSSSVLTNDDIADMCQRAAEHLRQLNTADPSHRAAISRVIQRLESPEDLHQFSDEVIA